MPILFEDFEDATVTYTGPADALDLVTAENYYGLMSLSLGADITYTNVQGTGFYGAQDTNSAQPVGLDPVVLNWTGLNISGFSSLEFSGFFAEDTAPAGDEDWDFTSSVIVEVQIDGGGFIPIFAIESVDPPFDDRAPAVDTNFDGIGDGAFITDAFTKFTQSILGFNGLPNLGSTLDLRITINDLSINHEDIAFDNISITCFHAGSMISTPGGEMPVEALAIGDLITTGDGRMVPVKWLGRQTIKKNRCIPERLEPVCITKCALGEGLPTSDLTVTADHGMIIDGLVVNASALVNGTTIRFVPHGDLNRRTTVYHIETENHDVILANGAPTETFVDIPGRMMFDNHSEYLDLYGTERIIPEMDRPRISSRRLLPDAIKERLGIVEEAIEFNMPLSA